ncbi:DUF5107 domain-containing protein [Lachnospiraceae bacterium 47-T17]
MDKGEAYVWKERVTIPTYEIGAAEKNPMFLDKRVYQGSSGRVYPYPTVETLTDTKTDKEYTALYLENEYIRIMILPELGGRIQRAYDKTNDYDFVYYNHVIKPALVGLTGPWISGGIEFNWPQHHRPTTFLPTDYTVESGDDGSKSVLIHDVDQMYGTKSLAKFTVYPGRAYIEITGQLYNRTGLPQTFLWWANPAVAAHENTQSVFPPDVHAVMDHGRRDVSSFPIATGVYYKKDYAPGTDISLYKNIPVPTSYMAEKSEFDFMGGYDYEKEAGLLHVADHHISPGKKQWTWGCGDFGQAWERSLTDGDGPYVELMTGVFSDNQPDFTWLMPFEEKTFRQYFMPYKGVGQVKNATTEVAVGLEAEKERVTVCVYGTSRRQVRVLLTCGFEGLLEEDVSISPTEVYKRSRECRVSDETRLTLSVYDIKTNRLLVSYRPRPRTNEPLPEPDEAIGAPEELATNEELYLAGLHLEQYRHATRLPDDYYLEGLKRDPGDIRINHACGTLLMRRGDFERAKPLLCRALERLTMRGGSAYDGEPFYSLALCELYMGQEEAACAHFYRASWSNGQQEMSFYYLAALEARAGRWRRSLELVKQALVKNAHNVKARGLQAYLFRKMGQNGTAARCCKNNLERDPFDFLSGNERVLLGKGKAEDLDTLMRGFSENYLMTARDYAEFGAYDDALELLGRCTAQTPLMLFYRAYYLAQLKRSAEAARMLHRAEEMPPDYCFPNKLEDIAVLRYAKDEADSAMARYYLGCLFYDKLQRDRSIRLWESAAAKRPKFPTVHRNLALAYYNVLHDKEAAKQEMEKAFYLNESDARVFLELDELYKRFGMGFGARLERYERYAGLVAQRDDLYIEYITLLNMTGQYEKAHDLTMQHHFHAWEGGEGRITAQYVRSLLEMANHALVQGDALQAERYLLHALVYPKNLGEGKLEGTKDNHIYYHLGLALELQEKHDEAEVYFKKATLGTDEPSGGMYYNDQPADMILYQGLAFLKLGEEWEAYRRFDRLIDYGVKHLDDEVQMDYFVVSVPQFQVFDNDYTSHNRAHCYYLIGLGYLGYGKTDKANESFAKVVEIEPWHTDCRMYADV